ncbi:MAG: 16S rRNA (guanine(527)-N(7))-methyltransferase RsmG [Bacteroidales bacterium]|jgi:16S rRNA (guanine527-N7)-methyltransferase|nr:16S rRNA (guanine(527)-N(7))-methyltransferase RsmG [Bacteroidales bacterium]
MDYTIISRYFPEVDEEKLEKFKLLRDLYIEWNSKINVISRKDIDSIYIKHILHSLAIAKFTNFKPGTNILDVGTGGGFPGVPLSIMFPECNFHLIDSIGKKIQVVKGVISSAGIKNAFAEQVRAENVPDKYHFVVSRAVTALPNFLPWVNNKIDNENFNALPNGFIFLKGGDLTEELGKMAKVATVVDLQNYFKEEFFETKKIVYLPHK